MSTLQYYIDLVLATKREVIRYRFMVALAFTVVLMVILLVASKWPQRYTTSVMIAVDVTNVIEPLLRGAAEKTQLDVSTKVGDVLSSRRILERAVIKLNPEASNYSPQQMELAVNKLRSGMEVTLTDRRSQTEVSFNSLDPTESYESLSAIVEIFLEDRVALKQKGSADAFNFISAQVVDYKNQLELAEQRLKTFRAQSVNATEADVRKRISELTASIDDLQIEIQETEETIRTTKQQLKNEGRFIDVRAKNASLEERRKALQTQLDQLRLSYQDSYPDIITIRSQIAEIDQRVSENLLEAGLQSAGEISELPLYEELRKQVSAGEVQILTQKRRLAALQNLLKDEEKLSGQVTEKQAELVDLTRDYDVTKSVYEDMLARKENAKLTMALNNEGHGENYKIIEPPVYPLSPSGLDPIFIYLAAPFLAIGFPLGIIFAYVFLDPRIRSAAKLQSILPENIELLAVVPHHGTPLGVRLMRKDMIILGFWIACLMGFYGYLGYLQLFLVEQ
jgi:polysaccharide chain length determinant protein (PEP-CTERM system associated)